MKRALLTGTAILLGTFACDETPAGPHVETGWIYLEVIVNGGGAASSADAPDQNTRAPAESAQNWDAIRVTVTGDDSFSWQVTRNPGDTVLTPGLTPGQYSVMLEGVVAGEVDYFGLTQSVNVTAGDTTRATIQFNDFKATPNALASPTTDVAFTVTFATVADASGYHVDLDTDASFPNPTTQDVTQPNASFTVTTPDVYHVRVRAYNQWVTAGRPGAVASVEIVADTTGDNPSSAVNLGSRSAANGTYASLNILPAGDVDLFALNLLSGDYVTASVLSSSLSNPSELDPALALLDAAETVIAENEAAGEVSLDSVLIAADGTYYLRVKARAAPLATADGDSAGTMSPSAVAQRTDVGHYEIAVRVDVPPMPAIAYITVSPAGATVEGLGGTKTFSAQAYDASEAPISGLSYTWTSLNPNVATITAGTGAVTAVGAGQTSIRAGVDGVAGYAVVTVTAPNLPAVNLWQQVNVGTSTILWDVWAASGSAVFAAGEGVVAHYDGAAWTATSLPGANSVWGTSAADVFVGGFGKVYHFDGAAWTETAGPTARGVASLWGASPDDVIAVGELGTAWKYDGSSWTDLTNATGTSETLNAVIGWSASEVMAGGSTGVTLGFDGTNWTSLNSAPLTLRGLWGPASSDVFGTGTTNVNQRFNGTDWSSMSGSPVGGHDVWGADVTDVYVVGSSNTITRFDGAAFTVTTVDAVGQLNAVWGAPGGHVYVVGVSGAVLRGYRGAMVTVSPDPYTLTAIDQTIQLSAAAADAGSNAIGTGVTYTWTSSDDNIATVDANGLVTAVANGIANITATAAGGAAGSAEITVQQTAATLSVTPAGFAMSTADSPQTPFTVDAQDANGHAIPSPAVNWSSLNPNVVTIDPSAGQVTAVGSGQSTVRGELDGVVAYALMSVASSGAPAVNLWVDEYSGTETYFMDVWGWSPDHVYALGHDTGVWRFDGASWTAMAGSPRQARSIWGSSPSDIYVLHQPDVVHFDGSSWTVATRMDNLYWVWGSSPVDVYALGSDAAGDLLHYDGSSWSTGTTGAADQLRSVWGSSANDIFAVGDQGTIRHYDGSSWSAMASGTTDGRDQVWGTSSTSVFASGAFLAQHYEGGTWSPMPSTGAGASNISGSADDDVFVTASVGFESHIYRYDGSSWSLAYETTSGADIASVWVAPTGDVFAVGGQTNGSIFHGYRNATVTVSPDPYTLTAIDETVQLTATAADAGSNPISGVDYTWSSDNESVATVDANGLVTAVANGTATIIATAPGGAAGTASITVQQAAAMVLVSPGGFAVTTADPAETPFRVVAQDGDGNAIPSPTVTLQAYIDQGAASRGAR